MAKFSVSKKSLEPPARLPGGVYEVVLNGFKPNKTKGTGGKEKSVNLNPQMKVINHTDPEINGKNVRDFLNQNAGWIIQDFVHAFGFEMVDKGDTTDIPGEFVGPDESPEKWTYQGPLLGQTASLELVEVPANDNSGKVYTNVKRYICKVPGCSIQHSENLTKTA